MGRRLAWRAATALACIATTPPDDTITFVGETDAAAVAKLSGALTAPDAARWRWLTITSAGGDAPSGMALGRLVHEHHLGVRVRGYCASACAQYVFPAGHRRLVESGALALFHATVTMKQRLHAAVGSAGAAVFALVAAEEMRFWHDIGRPPDPAAWDSAALGPNCIIVDPRRPPLDPNRYGYGSRYVAYAVSRGMAERFAGRITGFWPSNEAAMRATLARLPFDARMTVAWLSQPPAPPPARWLPRC